MNTLRVLLVSPGLTPHFGGSAVSEASLAQSLGHKCELTVICRKDNFDEAFATSFALKDVKQYSPGEVLRAWWSKSHWLNSDFAAADVLHLNGHWKWENYFFARLAIRHGVSYVLHPRGMLILNYRKTALKRFFNFLIGHFIVKHAAKVIALSNFEVAQFKPYPVSAEQTVVIPNGITSPTAVPKIAQTEKAFLYLGRIERRKNLLFLLDAFKLYSEKNGKFRLAFVGPAERGYDVEVRDHAKKIGVENSILFLPPAYGPEKWAWMANSAAVVYPTLEEPFGRVPFEALSVGAPVIVPKRSGSYEYLRARFPDCGYEDQRPESLADRMHFVEAQSPSLNEQVNDARRWVASRLDWEKISDEVIRLYESTLPQSPKRKIG